MYMSRQDPVEGSSTSQARPRSDPIDGSHPGPQPHEELWFEDGSIILASDVHLYRVHKSMLVKYSTVLRDKLGTAASSEHSKTPSDTWSGIPIIKMDGDDDGAVFILLKSLYKRNFRDSLEEVEFSSLVQLLTISIKYNFEEIRADVVRYLQSLFPRTFEEYKARKLLSMPVDCSDAFSLLAIAVHEGILAILPVIYYFCANYPINDIARNFHLLPARCIPGFLNGRDWMTKLSFYLLMKVLQFDADDVGICTDKQCMKQCRDQLIKNYNFESEECPTSILDVPDRGALVDMDTNDSKVCKKCEEYYMLCVRNAKLGFWDSLPSLFYLGTWEELKAP